MPDLQELESRQDPERTSGCRLFHLFTGTELFLPFLDEQMSALHTDGTSPHPRKDRVEQTTVFVVVMKHYSPLHEGFIDELASRAYTTAAAKGAHMGDVTVTLGSALVVKDELKGTE